MNFDLKFTEVCSSGSNLQYSSIGSDNGLAPFRRQAIIWINDGSLTDAYMRHTASMSWYAFAFYWNDTGNGNLSLMEGKDLTTLHSQDHHSGDLGAQGAKSSEAIVSLECVRNDTGPTHGKC